ncbi:hypothetical protein D3C85_1743610 [compost metagenome]
MNNNQENKGTRISSPFNVCDAQKEKIIMSKLVSMQKLQDKISEIKIDKTRPSRFLSSDDGPGLG